MSGSQIAYHLRVNKFIDRQLFVETLDLVSRFIPLTGHGYVSMAGAYLEDCRVLHQAIRISRMYSFDTQESVIARQEVNRPFGFIQCQKQSSKQLVENFDSVRNTLSDSEINVVVWLDYANARQRQSQLQELGTLVPKLISGDVVRITLNANRATLGENAEYERLPPEQKSPTLAAWRHARLKDQLGEYFPPDRDDPDHMATKEGLFRTLIRAVKRVVVGTLEARPELIAFPVLSTAYDDQHGMVTISCVILRAEELNEFVQATRWDSWEHKPDTEWDEFTEIQVPHLSMRERHLLHRTIEHGGTFGGDQLQFLTADEFEQYQAHYLRYPTFAPLDIL